MVIEDAGRHGLGATLEACVLYFLNLCISNVYQSLFQYVFQCQNCRILCKMLNGYYYMNSGYCAHGLDI
jgi:hypothetical protein